MAFSPPYYAQQACNRHVLRIVQRECILFASPIEEWVSDQFGVGLVDIYNRNSTLNIVSECSLNGTVFNSLLGNIFSVTLFNWNEFTVRLSYMIYIIFNYLDISDHIVERHTFMDLGVGMSFFIHGSSRSLIVI